MKTYRSQQEIKVKDEVIGYQFAMNSMGERTFIRAVDNIHPTGEQDYKGRDILEGTAVIMDRVVKVRSWITLHTGRVLVWKAIEKIGWAS